MQDFDNVGSAALNLGSSAVRDGHLLDVSVTQEGLAAV